MKKLYLLAFIVGSFFLAPKASAAVFYSDLSTTTCSGNGVSTSTAFCSLNAFTDVARNAGDILFVRRGSATTTGMVDVTFTSDGTTNAPIVVSGDLDHAWPDGFATSTQTYTFTEGSKTVIASANQSDIEVGEWVYAAGDCREVENTSALNMCDFYYEVSAVTSSTITLYFPYKGTKAGAGNSVRILGRAPQWGTTTNLSSFNMSADNGWYFKSFDARGTAGNGTILPLGSDNILFADFVVNNDGATAPAYSFVGYGTIYAKKIRAFNTTAGFGSANASGGKRVIMDDYLIDCNNVANSVGVFSPAFFTANSGEIVNCTSDFSNTTGFNKTYTGRGLIRRNTYAALFVGGFISPIYIEDDFNIVGVNSFSSAAMGSATTPTTTINTSTQLRAGGADENLLVIPPAGTTNAGLSMNSFPLSAIKLFEYPMYVAAGSQTYSMYFSVTSTLQFTADPTASELWIECEYYTSSTPSDATRITKGSTGTVPFSTLTTWNALSVTCSPNQAGLLYLRGWYAKPREARANQFLMDIQPVITP